MFGHQNTLNPQQDNSGAVTGPQSDTASTNDVIDTATFNAPSTLPSPTVSTPSVANDDQPTTATSAPTVDSTSDVAGDYIMTDPPQATASTPVAPASDPPAAPAPAPEPVASTDDLLDLKQGALQQLTPLLDHLDQTPEEKFRTTMMMIQAADNQALLKTAYDTAQQITDEKARAQALLDVVNEINYFTQQGNGEVDHSEGASSESL